MTRSIHRLASYAPVYLRLALGVTFLTAVGDRFGLLGPPGTPNVAWGNFENFLAYAAILNPYLPASWIPLVGWTATIAEVVLGLALIVGFRTRVAALSSGVLLLLFAFGMTVGLGIAAPLSYSVFTASAGAFLLAVYPTRESVAAGPASKSSDRGSPSDAGEQAALAAQLDDATVSDAR